MIEWSMYGYSFLVGICFASFINVVIWRVPLHISVAKGRSYCPECHHTLAGRDLIPIISYLILRGKCRFCGTHIKLGETIIEFFGGVLGMFCFYRFSFHFEALLTFMIFMLLFAISMIDLHTMMIPNGLLLALLPLIMGMVAIHPEISIGARIVGVFCISLPMYLLILLIPDSFGGGDVKLIAICGFLLGWEQTLSAVCVAVILGGIYATYLLLAKKAEKTKHIAFGPYLAIGISISMLFGKELLACYFTLLGI